MQSDLRITTNVLMPYKTEQNLSLTHSAILLQTVLPKVVITKSKFVNETPTVTETLHVLETAFCISFTTKHFAIEKVAA